MGGNELKAINWSVLFQQDVTHRLRIHAGPSDLNTPKPYQVELLVFSKEQKEQSDVDHDSGCERRQQV